MMDEQQTSSIGCGLLGCAGDMVLGFLGGVLLIAILSLLIAVLSPNPTISLTDSSPDIRLTITEDFLNRFMRDSTGNDVRVDIIPGTQFNIRVNTSVSVLGASVPVEIVGLFELRLNGQTVEVHLLDTRVSDITLPPEVTDFFAGSLSELNTELNVTLNNVSTVLGLPLTFVNMGSDESTFWLEAKEVR